MLEKHDKRVLVKSLVIGLLMAIGAIYSTDVAQAGEFRCTLKAVAVYGNRIHCECTTTVPDGSDTIRFFAVPTADAKLADRLLTIGTTALVSGRRFIAGFKDGDVSGNSFDCLAKDCRKLTSFGME
jgi:hypothetical protein